MGECTCFPTPPSTHTTHYGAIEPASALEPNPECREHFRKPPYRLADGTWSDGVDRSVPLYGSDYNLRNPKRLAVTLVRDTGQWRAAIKRSRKGKRFDTHAEAIAYADKHARMARTKQGENNE